jgi:hypothetical protein
MRYKCRNSLFNATPITIVWKEVEASISAKTQLTKRFEAIPNQALIDISPAMLRCFDADLLLTCRCQHETNGSASDFPPKRSRSCVCYNITNQMVLKCTYASPEQCCGYFLQVDEPILSRNNT